MIIYMPDRAGKHVRKVRTGHRLGDTQAKMQYLRPDKRQSEVSEPFTKKRQKK